MTTHELLLAAKAAAPALAWLGSEEKNAAILRMADAIVRETDVILAANEADVQAAKGTISDVMLDRLRLTQARIAAMADGMRQVSALPDPVGEVLAEVRRPNGLVIRKTAVPLGVVAIIYESRPNVTSDAAVLAMKSGNVCVLRGGKEAYRSAAAIVAAMHEGLREAGLPETFVNLVSDPTRRSAQELMTASGLVDLLIPRGGAGLIRACVESATVPCIETGTGICHVYVDKDADLEKALNIIENAKTSRPSVCNAEEVALVHRDVAGAFLPRLKARLVDARAAASKIPVELRLDAAAQAIIPGTPAGERDFDTEFLDYILALKVVSDADEAIRHIAALHRRRRVRPRLRDGHFHAEAPRPGPDGPAGADHLQIYRHGRRTDPVRRRFYGRIQDGLHRHRQHGQRPGPGRGKERRAHAARQPDAGKGGGAGRRAGCEGRHESAGGRRM